MGNESNKGLRPRIAWLAVGLPMLLFAQALPAGLGYISGHLAGVFIGAGLSFAGLLLLLRRRFSLHDSMAPIAAYIIGQLTGFAAGFFFHQAGALGRGGEIVRGISVDEAPQHAGAPGWVFRDGLPRSDLAAASTRKQGRYSERRWVVAPLVSAKWKLVHEVPAWVGCEDGCKKEWAAPYRAGSRIVVDLDQFKHARDFAMHRHGLRSAAHAPFVAWMAKPETVVPGKLRWGAILLGIGLLLYGVPCIFIIIGTRVSVEPHRR